MFSPASCTCTFEVLVDATFSGGGEAAPGEPGCDGVLDGWRADRLLRDGAWVPCQRSSDGSVPVHCRGVRILHVTLIVRCPVSVVRSSARPTMVRKRRCPEKTGQRWSRVGVGYDWGNFLPRSSSGPGHRPLKAVPDELPKTNSWPPPSGDMDTALV